MYLANGNILKSSSPVLYIERHCDSTDSYTCDLQLNLAGVGRERIGALNCNWRVIY